MYILYMCLEFHEGWGREQIATSTLHILLPFGSATKATANHRLAHGNRSSTDMSTNPPALGNSNTSTDARDALIIGAAVIALLVFLVALRFFCNLFLDITLLGEPERARRSLSEVFRCLCPWWHVRTQPEADTTSNDIRNNSPTEQPALILKSKILTRADIEEQKSHQVECEEGESTTSQSLMCSICLHELHAGDFVFVGDCRHVFHQNCMQQWVESRGRDCPNCRSEIVPPQLDET